MTKGWLNIMCEKREEYLISNSSLFNSGDASSKTTDLKTNKYKKNNKHY